MSCHEGAAFALLPTVAVGCRTGLLQLAVMTYTGGKDNLGIVCGICTSPSSRSRQWDSSSSACIREIIGGK